MNSRLASINPSTLLRRSNALEPIQQRIEMVLKVIVLLVIGARVLCRDHDDNLTACSITKKLVGTQTATVRMRMIVHA